MLGVKRAAAAATALVLLSLPQSAQAQQSGGTAPPPSAPAAPSTNAPAAPSGPADATPVPVQQLPEVQVIQAQPKPPAPRQIQQAAKPKPVAPVTQPAPIAPIEQDTSGAEPTQVKMSPVGGSEIPIAKVPGSVNTVSSSDIARGGFTAVQNVLETQVPGIIVNDLQGNDFQTNVQFHGFEASPVNGVPQGLAVYENGVRINEAFGDIVNWDFIPAIAISDIAVTTNNPAFGLNALGGSVNITMKDGFNFQGVETDFRAGSFGRIQGSVQAGQQAGNYAAYIAVEDIHDDGWRQFSPADIRRMFADIGFKNHDAEFHANFTGADNFVGAVAASPVELLDQSYSAVFTNPQTTQNDMAMGSVNGSVNVTDTLKVSGVSYYRSFRQHHVDANASDAAPCSGDPALLCFDGDPLFDQRGNPVITPANGDQAVGEIDRISQQAESYGGSLQAVQKAKVWGHGNQFLVGASIDHGRVGYQTSAEIGSFGPQFVVTGDGQIVQNSDIEPVNITTTNTYYGVFFSDTFDVTDRLSLTAGGRFNYADIRLKDNTGEAPELNGNNKYQRFNPMAGGTYQLVPGLTLYSGYSEANRTPVAAELACADPNNPCLIESFLTGDPPLKQVVSRTAEVGFRGESTWLDGRKMTWSLGYFHAMNSDDIISVASAINGRSYFQNAGNTLREGVDASIDYRNDRLYLFASYNFTDARFESTFDVNSPNNPLNPSPGNDFITTVRPGDRMPGVPQHRFKAGFDYWMTQKWKFGGDLIAASDQIFFGDDANQNAPLPGYAVVNLHTSYDVTKNVQVYALVNNIFDHHYATYGNYFNIEDASAASLGTIDFTDARTVTPATPLAAYGGFKVRF
ncbi:TonB-dependent receptor [Hyphomicrobium sp.]|uniref:TonB-dependent receptor domain-containing protein n=1 Tax=Hyphomicrobium sp. TaxID=82 RepID=UPI000FA10EB0|nr:TonB-dependent receptor [Hyphomicrobium sp.]RUO98471.1 MAG: TonB-dependent receptor [Hyphomicrobium sp.]